MNDIGIFKFLQHDRFSMRNGIDAIAGAGNRAEGGATGDGSTISLKEGHGHCSNAGMAQDLITAAPVERLANLIMMPRDL
ncbi:uncharacterized protein RAG0_15309 [Rhynchosporium agropyri]|uniref:Uncharacterized protein n=2 Tax=Rhynchosporium TaxID=38037 RepID=A0A1E1MHJ4_RHYSE|nr:uncharacterized protein RAG0_15309 [Rhynchosporium agropyri]CZT48559.1 uncharacterized protein RSE6_09271 [Rhynchosporium secalis]